MSKLYLLCIGLITFYSTLFGQISKHKMLYVIDSIPILYEPKEDIEIFQSDIADRKVIINKDSLKLLGYRKFDGVTYIFTKEYRNRPDSLKQIPSSAQMENISGAFLLHNSPYNGRIIDYYLNGHTQSERICLNGRLNGYYKRYNQNGKILFESEYKDGIANGLDLWYYEDGSLKQKCEFVNGRKNGICVKYCPNVQISQRSNYVNGVMQGELTDYYSSGKVINVQEITDGKVTANKGIEKILPYIHKGYVSYCKKDYKSAIENYSKVIELDSSYAFADRAFVRIRKYQSEYKKSNSKKREVAIPDDEHLKICSDLQRAVFLGADSEAIRKAL